MDAFDPAILNEFLTEAEELLESLDHALLALERDPVDADALDAAFRSLHTIKGNASFFGLPDMVALAHAAESALASSRESGAGVERRSLEALFDAAQALRRQLVQVRAGDACGAPDEALLRRLGQDLVNASDHAANQSGEASRDAIQNAAMRDLQQSLSAIETGARYGELEDVPGIIQGMIRTAQFFAWSELEESFREIRRTCTLASPESSRKATALDHSLRVVIAAARRELDRIAIGGSQPPNGENVIDSTLAPHPENRAGIHHEMRSVRVDVDRLESLLDLVGELVLRKNYVSRLVHASGPLSAASNDVREIVHRFAEDLDRLTSDLQHATMRVRMQPVRLLLARFPRLIRDLAREAGKEVELIIEGAETELDRAVIEGLADSLAHLLRNSLDHGVETPAERELVGKPRAGVIRIRASAAGDYAVLRIADDGRGVDRERVKAIAVERGVISAAEAQALSDAEVDRLIFTPGFSTATHVTNLSGRGVGMDVVRRSVERLGGSIDVESSPGRGSVVTLRVPLNISIIEALTVAVGEEVYAIPLANIVETRRVREGQPTNEATAIPLRQLLATPHNGASGDPFAVIVEQHGRRTPLLVSELRGRTDIVTKPLSRVWLGSAPFSAATIDPDGRVLLVLDVARTLECAAQAASFSANDAGEPS